MFESILTAFPFNSRFLSSTQTIPSVRNLYEINFDIYLIYARNETTELSNGKSARRAFTQDFIFSFLILHRSRVELPRPRRRCLPHLGPLHLSKRRFGDCSGPFCSCLGPLYGVGPASIRRRPRVSPGFDIFTTHAATRKGRRRPKREGNSTRSRARLEAPFRFLSLCRSRNPGFLYRPSELCFWRCSRRRLCLSFRR